MPISTELAEIIREKKAKYCRLVDTKGWDELADVLWPDVSMVFIEPDGQESHRFDSYNAFRNQSSGFFATVRSSHRVSYPELTQISPTKIEGIWGVDDYIAAGPGAPFKSHRGYGRYHDSWELRDGEWKIATLRLEREIVDVE